MAHGFPLGQCDPLCFFTCVLPCFGVAVWRSVGVVSNELIRFST
ncbi:hypothetical protein MINT15_15830 [Saccharomonospora viridis]|uniref:Uncharacterized protein n=1 Tax=Saccharomonospora viridis TaxID=1852 RepID=A0A837DDR2_9PSEU|nr:hypothetical protein MINT15_15830 [Saccharomonospora viridis]